ncbi:unnamed protein product [Chilo suppressalis]|uniref:Deleted in lung and esophageal cancer protein 1 n=1 Tax=Chilo suppressalis TaxID=168631 RepID=A0ABN8L4J9_CHISP|nr:unnamed protein product [Chilo suppressalis]
MRLTQKEQYPWEEPWKPLTASEAFMEEDRKRAVRTENTCHCRYKNLYVPEVKRPQPPRYDDEGPPIEIVTEPPPLTRICACDDCTKPTLPDRQEPICLQFQRLPLKTVRTRRLVLRNESVITARWQTAVRNFPRKRNRTLASDPWAADVTEAGVAIQVSPSGGVLGPCARIELTISAYADCWGLYRDQILIMMEKLEPLVVDVWLEVAGAPLSFCMRPNSDCDEETPTLWISSSDRNRVVRVKNTSRSELAVHSYVLLENEHLQDALPFRLYFRFFDVLPQTCPCVNTSDSQDLSFDEESACESIPEEMGTGIELFLSADYGQQENTCFKVEPEMTTIAPGAYQHFQVTFETPEHGEQAQNAILLLRPLPTKPAGPCWYRPEPAPQAVQLRPVVRTGVLRASDCKLQVQYCALHLPRGDIMRIRKTFRIQNVGNGHLDVQACTSGAWSIVMNHHHQLACGSGCGCVNRSGERTHNVALHYPPMSSNQMTVEVCIHTADVWPRVEASASTSPQYEQWKKTVTPLHFYDSDNVLLSIPLILKLEYPRVNIEPAAIDFGFVADGDTRKSYFTVSHSSRTVTLDLAVIWTGSDAFRLWPKTLLILPGTSERVYVQYIATWCGGPVEGVVRVEYSVGAGGVGAGGAGAWCAAAAAVRAAPARDHKCRAPAHDYTDDGNLLPPDLLGGFNQN